jgi:hypothetical protein
MLSAPETKSGRLQRACLEVLSEHEDAGALPTSVRFIFYELVQSGIIEKKPAGGKVGGRRPDQDLCDALFKLREIGAVPWHWIVDETRSVHVRRFADSVATYLADTVDLARLDLWNGEPPPFIITESRSLAGVLYGLADEYLASITATNGQVGGHLRTEVAPRLVEGQRVLYLGDYDWQGGQIEDNTRAVLERLVGPLDWLRLAITAEQAVGLPVISKPDRRYKPVRYHDAVETEALGQSAIVAIVRAHLDLSLPQPLGLVQERERQQREAVASLLRA